MKKYKINKYKIKRNLIIFTLLILTTLYINLINNYTNKNIKNCQAFTEYAKQNGIFLTQDNYNTFIKK